MDYVLSMEEGRRHDRIAKVSESTIISLIQKAEYEKNENELVTAGSRRGESYYADDGRPGEIKLQNLRQAIYLETLYRDMKTDAFVMRDYHGTVIRQASCNDFYRGEKYIYPESMPSLYRKIKQFESEKDKEIYRLIADLRIAEFDLFLHKFNRVRMWEEYEGLGLSVLTEALAQHYGIETSWLDITNDFMTALFFASCYWKNGSWHPLTEKEITDDPSHKYGVIYHIPYWAVEADSNIYMFMQDRGYSPVSPIGYQPFRRCNAQYAYGIKMNKPIDLISIPGFERFAFPHTKKITEFVYEAMDYGRKIYPDDGLSRFSKDIKRISNSLSFSEEAFIKVLTEKGIASRKEEFEYRLENFSGGPVSIKKESHPFHIDMNLLRKQNRKDSNFSIEDEYGIELRTRLVYRPSEDTRKL